MVRSHNIPLGGRSWRMIPGTESVSGAWTSSIELEVAGHSVGQEGCSPSHLSGFSLWFCRSFFPQFLEEEDTTERQGIKPESRGVCAWVCLLSQVGKSFLWAAEPAAQSICWSLWACVCLVRLVASRWPQVPVSSWTRGG